MVSLLLSLIKFRTNKGPIQWGALMLMWRHPNAPPKHLQKLTKADQKYAVSSNTLFLLNAPEMTPWYGHTYLNCTLTKIITYGRVQINFAQLPGPHWYVKWKKETIDQHDDVVKWKHFPHYWPFVRGIHRSPVNSPHKGQWRGALMFSLICAWINGSVNNREAGDLRRHHVHYDVTVMNLCKHMLQWESSVTEITSTSSALVL